MLTSISYSIISFCCKAAHLHNHLSLCSGVTVPWQPGSVWTTYPYQRHENSIGWMPISFSGKRNTITICADSCQGHSDQLEGPCRLCKALPDSVKFHDFVQQASRAIGEDYIDEWRRENNIPDSDGLAAMMDDQQKRGRSDTVSTTLSDSHDAKRARLTGIPE